MHVCVRVVGGVRYEGAGGGTGAVAKLGIRLGRHQTVHWPWACSAMPAALRTVWHSRFAIFLPNSYTHIPRHPSLRTDLRSVPQLGEVLEGAGVWGSGAASPPSHISDIAQQQIRTQHRKVGRETVASQAIDVVAPVG